MCLRLHLSVGWLGEVGRTDELRLTNQRKETKHRFGIIRLRLKPMSASAQSNFDMVVGSLWLCIVRCRVVVKLCCLCKMDIDCWYVC